MMDNGPSNTQRTNWKEVEAIFDRESGARTSRRASAPFAQNVWVYSAVTLIAQSFSQIDLALWQRSKATKNSRRRGFVQVLTHPILDLLDQPNSMMGREDFMEMFATYLLTGGNVFIQKSGKSGKLPEELLLWGVNRCRPLYHPNTKELVAWQVTRPDGKKEPVPLDEMIHIKLPNPYDSVLGLPPLACIALQLDADLARTIYDKAFFGNNASPDAVLVYKPGPLGEDQREQIRQSWNEFHQGADKAGGLAIVGGDYDFKVWGLSHSAVQFLENRAFTREEVSSVYKIPATLLNAVTRTGLTREALTAANRSFYENSIFPLCGRFKAFYNRQLIRKVDPNMMIDFEIDLLPIMSSFLKDKAEVLEIVVRAGGSINDCIESLNLSWEPQEGGDSGFLPGNYVSITELAKAKVMQQPVEVPPGLTVPKKEKDKRILLLISRLKPKVKGMLFNMRAETLKNKNVFNLEKLSQQWIRKISPICAASVQFGLERPLGRTWLDSIDILTTEDIEILFTRIQELVANSRISPDEANEDFVAIIVRSLELIKEYHEKLLNSDNIEIDTIKIFSSIQSEAQRISESIVASCVNAGSYTSSIKNHLPMYIDCEHGTDKRYPGDSSLEYRIVSNCSCILGGVDE